MKTHSIYIIILKSPDNILIQNRWNTNKISCGTIFKCFFPFIVGWVWDPPVVATSWTILPKYFKCKYLTHLTPFCINHIASAGTKKCLIEVSYRGWWWGGGVGKGQNTHVPLLNENKSTTIVKFIVKIIQFRFILPYTTITKYHFNSKSNENIH